MTIKNFAFSFFLSFLFFVSDFFSKTIYSGYLNNRLVWYLNGWIQSDHQMVHYSSHGLLLGIWKTNNYRAACYDKVCNSNCSVIWMYVIKIPTLFHRPPLHTQSLRSPWNWLKPVLLLMTYLICPLFWEMALWWWKCQFLGSGQKKFFKQNSNFLGVGKRDGGVGPSYCGMLL